MILVGSLSCFSLFSNPILTHIHDPTLVAVYRGGDQRELSSVHSRGASGFNWLLTHSPKCWVTSLVCYRSVNEWMKQETCWIISSLRLDWRELPRIRRIPYDQISILFVILFQTVCGDVTFMDYLWLGACSLTAISITTVCFSWRKHRILAGHERKISNLDLWTVCFAGVGVWIFIMIIPWTEQRPISLSKNKIYKVPQQLFL